MATTAFALDYLETIDSLGASDDSLGALGCGETASGCQVTECCITNCQAATCAATCGVTCS